MNNHPPSMLKPAMIGGLALGAAAGLPFVGALNCACCALIMGGGFLAAFLYSKECRIQGAEFRPGSGAKLGLIAAPFYALGSTVIGGIIQMVTGQSIEQVIEQVESTGQELPPEAAPVIEFLTTTPTAVLFLIGFLMSLVLAVIFSTIGGAIGGAVFKVQSPTPTSGGEGAPPA